MDKKEYIKFHIEDFLHQHELSTTDSHVIISREELSELCEVFLDFLLIDNEQFLGVESWLQWIYGCLLQKFFNESKKHVGVRMSDVPELMAIHNDIEEFKILTKKYLKIDLDKEG